MVEAHSINAEHKDLIHDVAFDYYGERMATCSTDQFVKVSRSVDGLYYYNYSLNKCILYPLILF